MHKTQFKIIELAAKKNIEKMGPRAIGREIGVKHPQVVVYHLNQLKKIGLLPRKSKAIIEKLEKKGLVFSGKSPDGVLMEIAELPQSKHPFFLGTQFHPEFLARPLSPHPLFSAFIKAVAKRKRR